MEERAFLDAIADNPDDDVARLVYADWLQEHDRPEDEARAEFIRVQVRLAQMRPDEADVEPLRRRERELLETYETGWRLELPAYATPQWRWGPFERGFVETVEVDDWDMFEPRFAEVLAAQPIRRLIINRLGESSRRSFAECERLTRLTALTLGRDRRGERLAESVTESPHLSGLRHLNIRANGDGNAWCRAMQTARAWPQLRSLDLANIVWGASHIPELFHITHWHHLEELGLRDTRLDANGLIFCLNSPLAASLKSLDCGRCHINGSGLNETPFLTGSSSLCHLNLSANDIQPQGLASLARTERLSKLERLGMASCRLQGDAIAVLGESPFWLGLTDLDLSRNELTDAGLRALGSLPSPPNLRSLNLTQTRIAEFRPLAEWPALATLESLRVCDNPTAGIFRLLAAKHAERLRSLTLSRIGIGEQGVQLLIDGSLLPGLRVLDLSHNQIGDRGIKMLTESPAVSELASLHLEGNPITDDGAQYLIVSPHLNRLWRLHLDGHRLSDATREALRERFGPFVMTG